MSGRERERWARQSEILDQLLEMPESARGERIAELRETDPAVAEELLSLLAHGEVRGLLDAAPAASLATLVEEAMDESALELERVGPWRLVRELGRGGMGVVYLAERADGQYEQQAALKLVKRGLDTEEVLARFRRERQILARLRHPAIAQLLDGGVAGDGRPYFAMEYIEGQPITEFCDQRRLTVEERLTLLLRVCDAVQHAHRNLVVHRDLKPSNILVTSEGGLKLLDFGIAKLLGGEEGSAATEWTRLGRRAMTPAYAAPEQLRGEAVTTATDVYALGVVLYELLTGRRPFRPPRGLGAEAERAYLEVESTRPSGVFATAAEAGAPTVEEAASARRATPAGLRRRVSGDLDAITLTALRKEPERRYPTVQALADDLRRHLSGEPVTARPESRLYRGRKFIRRHRVGAAIAAAAAVATVGFAAAMAGQAQRIARERDRAERVSGFLSELFRMAAPSAAQGREVTARELLDRGVERIEGDLAQEPGLQSQLLHTMAEAYWGLGLYGQAEPLLARTVELRRRELGPRDPLTLSAMNRLANIRAREGRYGAALELFAETLAAQRAALGIEHRETLRSLNDLAFWHGEVGHYEEAEALHREALEIRRRVLGAEHEQTLWSLHDLAIVHWRQGRYAEAEQLLEQVLATWQRAGHSGSTDTFKENLASVYLAQGRPADAESILREVLSDQKRLFGPEHPAPLATAKDLALAYRLQGRYQEAETLLAQTLATLRRAVGSEHPVTLLAMAGLARVQARQGRGTEAAALLGEALAVQRRTLGATHPDTIASQYDMACLAALAGEPSQALAWLREAVAGGWRRADLMSREADLESVRGEPEFQRLVEAARARRAHPAPDTP